MIDLGSTAGDPTDDGLAAGSDVSVKLATADIDLLRQGKKLSDDMMNRYLEYYLKRPGA